MNNKKYDLDYNNKIRIAKQGLLNRLNVDNIELIKFYQINKAVDNANTMINNLSKEYDLK